MKNGTSVVSDTQREQFREEGLCILESVIDTETVTMLREECSYFLGYIDAVMDEQGITSIGITHRGSRYFISNRYRASRRMRSFLFGELMTEVTRRLLGDEVFLFNEQWVVKGPEQGMKFAWHQDSGYVTTRDPSAVHPPYLTCWCALDDVDEANGTAYVLPHSRGGTRNTIYEPPPRGGQQRPRRLRRRRSGRAGDRPGGQRRGVQQLQPAPQRPQYQRRHAPRLSDAVQQRAGPRRRGRAVGHGGAVPVRRAFGLSARQGHSRALRSTPAQLAATTVCARPP